MPFPFQSYTRYLPRKGTIGEDNVGGHNARVEERREVGMLECLICCVVAPG
jgi:hypothetical protein